MNEQLGSRPTWAKIDLRNLENNFKSAKEFLGREIQYLAVVKGDAYGHGAVECSKRLEAVGIDWLGVAIPEEGIELRTAGITKEILCLGGLWPGQENALLEMRLTPVIHQYDAAERLNKAASEKGMQIPVHIKFDTGMHRLGFDPAHAAELADRLARLPNLNIDGLMSHFAAADDVGEKQFASRQISEFERVEAVFRTKGFAPRFVDIANSPGSVAFRPVPGNMVRLGGILYGLCGDTLPAGIPAPRFQPVLSLHSRITELRKIPAGESIGYGRTFITTRPSIIAAVPIGYRDGYFRQLSNLGKALVRGSFAPVVGRVSMDWTMLDVTEIRDISLDDEIVLIGRQGNNEITAEDIAADASTISYEVTCSIDRRVKRIYI